MTRPHARGKTSCTFTGGLYFYIYILIDYIPVVWSGLVQSSLFWDQDRNPQF